MATLTFHRSLANAPAGSTSNPTLRIRSVSHRGVRRSQRRPRWRAQGFQPPWSPSWSLASRVPWMSPAPPSPSPRHSWPSPRRSWPSGCSARSERATPSASWAVQRTTIDARWPNRPACSRSPDMASGAAFGRTVAIAGGAGQIGRRLVGGARGPRRRRHRAEPRSRIAPGRGRVQPRRIDAGRAAIRPGSAGILDGVDAVVGLTGVPVGPWPWTSGRRRAIRRVASSRPGRSSRPSARCRPTRPTVRLAAPPPAPTATRAATPGPATEAEGGRPGSGSARLGGGGDRAPRTRRPRGDRPDRVRPRHRHPTSAAAARAAVPAASSAAGSARGGSG